MKQSILFLEENIEYAIRHRKHANEYIFFFFFNEYIF